MSYKDETLSHYGLETKTAKTKIQWDGYSAARAERKERLHKTNLNSIFGIIQSVEGNCRSLTEYVERDTKQWSEYQKGTAAIERALDDLKSALKSLKP